jgi:hypothetical protein
MFFGTFVANDTIAPATVSVGPHAAFNLSTLLPGIHLDQLQICFNNGTFAGFRQCGVKPRVIPLTLLVLPSPVISLSSPTLALTVLTGDPAQPPQQISIVNIGGGSLINLAGAIAYVLGAPGWLARSFPGGTTANPSAALQLDIDPTGLSQGTYTATVTVSAGNATGTKDLTITLTVLP